MASTRRGGDVIQQQIEIQNLVTDLNRQQLDLIEQQQAFIRKLQDFISLGRRQGRQQQQRGEADIKLISDEWAEEVRLFLEPTQEGVPDDTGRVRVSRALRDAKPEAYIPQMVSLGPYHHSSLKDESVNPFHKRPTYLSQMEIYKLRSSKEAARNDPQIIEDMFARVNQSDMLSRFQQFYNWKINEEDAPNFAWMMMVDALFLSYFLKSGFDDARQLDSSVDLRSSAFKEIYNPAKSSIRFDIVKLENQVPLSLLKILQEIAGETANKLDSLLPSQMKRLSSFQVSDREISNLNEKHLLGCIHGYVSTFLQVQVNGGEEEAPAWRQRITNMMGNLVAGVFTSCYTNPARSGPRDFLEKYSAKELVKAGIKFKAFNDESKIRFSKNSETLYLPQITIIDTYTEVLLRNLMALEFNELGREKHVSNYVELMGCLIHTPEDVALLRESHIIDRQSTVITDDYVANMWDGISKTVFLAGFLELPGGLKAQIEEVLIKDYYKSKMKTKLSELHSQYLSSPWKLAMLLYGIIFLLLTALRTYFSVHTYQSGNSPTVNAR